MSESQKLADQCLKRFQETAKGATKTALLWFAALVIVWWNGIEQTINYELAADLEGIEAKDNEKKNAEETVSAARIRIDSLRKVKSKREKSIQEVEKKLNSMEEYVKLLQKTHSPRLLSRARYSQHALNRQKQNRAQQKRQLENLERNIEETTKKISESQRIAKAASKQYDKRVAALSGKQVPFKVLEQEFQSLTLYAPIIWNLLLVGLMFYLALSRRIAITLCCRAIRHLKEDESLDVSKNSLVDETPWWLAPLPYITNRSVEASQLRDALGWQFTIWKANLLVIIGLVCLFIMQLRVTYLGLWVVGKLNEHNVDGYQGRGVALFPIWIVSTFVFSIMVAWWWFRLTRLPDHFSDEPDPNALRWWESFASVVVVPLFFGFGILVIVSPDYKAYAELNRTLSSSVLSISGSLLAGIIVFSLYQSFRVIPGIRKEATVEGSLRLTRRQFLQRGLAYCVGASLIILLSWKVFRSLLSLLRSGLNANSFYRNKRTGIVHYVLHNGLIPGIERVSVHNFSAISSEWIESPKDGQNLRELLTKEEDTHLHLSRASYSFEQAAVMQLKKRNHRMACDLLVQGIQHDLSFKKHTGQPLSIRLFDLLAGVALRFDEPQVFDDMIGKAQKFSRESNQIQKAVLQARLKKWQDVNSTWRKRWLDKKTPVVWHLTEESEGQKAAKKVRATGSKRSRPTEVERKKMKNSQPKPRKFDIQL